LTSRDRRPTRRAALAALALAPFAPRAGRAQESVTLRIGSALDPQHPILVGARRMAEMLEGESKGRVKVNLFPSGQLGSQREMWQNVQAGALDGVIDASANLVNFVPPFGVLDLPYLVREEAAAYRLLDGPVIEETLVSRAVGAGFRVVNFWEVTFRNIYTRSRPINAVGDLKGLKLRVIPNPTFIALFRGLGAAPTPMAFGEIYTSLQQGVIDGAENDDVTYLSSKHIEVAPHLAVTRHMMLVNTFVMSERSWGRLSDDLKSLVRAASLEGRKAAIAERSARDGRAAKDIEAAGVKITRPDLAPFVEIGRKTYAEAEARLGKELVARVVGSLS
jgi:TRAP-type transport system periplasmic protein